MPQSAAGGSGTANTGSSNNYPPQECTWWANERYHQLTGYYVSWAGDAHAWLADAIANGWNSSNLPPDKTPSIIVLQAGVQGADGLYGHVGVVERINADGTVYTSDLNWGLSAADRSRVSNVTFRLGDGVSFIWVGGPPASPVYDFSAWQQNNPVTIAQNILSPTADVAGVLVALDAALTLNNPFDLSHDQLGSIQDSIPVVTGISGATYPDPLKWLGLVGTNMVFDLTAGIVRVLFLFLGAAILIKVGSAFIDYDSIAETTKSGRSSLAGLVGML